MKITEMDEEARREYFRLAKERSRGKQREEKLKLGIPHADDYQMPERHRAQLDEYTERVESSIRTELAELTTQDQYIIELIAAVTYGLENKITQIVFRPHGMLVAGWYPDAAASAAIEHAHRNSKLLKSETFTNQYRKFLIAVQTWSTRYRKYASPESIGRINAELSGEYKLPDSEPEPSPIKVEPPLPTDSDILASGRSKLLQQTTGA